MYVCLVKKYQNCTRHYKKDNNAKAKMIDALVHGGHSSGGWGGYLVY